jgi:hypothetical protein
MDSDRQAYSNIEVSSTRSFAIVFCSVFTVIGLYPLIRSGEVRVWSLAVAGVFLFFSFFFTSVLQPLNVLWFRFGLLLGRIVNPLVMSIIYTVVILPCGLVVRLLGKDLLRLRLEKNTSSYWVKRAPPGPEPHSLEDEY